MPPTAIIVVVVVVVAGVVEAVAGVVAGGEAEAGAESLFYASGAVRSHRRHVVQQIGGEEQVLVRMPELESDSTQYKAMELKVKNAEALQGQASASSGQAGR